MIHTVMDPTLAPPARRRNGKARPRLWLRTLATAALAVLSLAARPAHADPWYELYARAEKALAAEDWAGAVEHLNLALEKRADSGVRVRTYGMKVVDYLPYLHLGVAYFHLGQIDAALQAFETEERLGAVAASPTGLEALQRYRGLAQEARAAADRDEEARRQRILRQNLAEAEEREAAGDLDGAMEAVGRALAVSAEDPRALAAMERLRTAAARRQRQRSLDERVAKLLAQGRQLLADGDLAEAASVFRQALSLAPSAEAQALWDEAQARLRASLEGAQEAERRSLVTTGLREVREMESAGRLVPALDRLQQVLAVDSESREALALQDRLLRAQEEAEAETERRGTIASLLQETAADLAGERFEAAVSASHRLLAVDPGNTEALGHLATAYREIGRRLLGSGPRQNIPPAIRFVDLRQELEDGTLAQVVREPRLRLSGVILDDSPVEITVFETDGEPIAATAHSQPLGDFHLTEFTLDSPVAAGLSAFRLVATDPEQVSSSSEYRVFYRRPWYRSPLFLGALAALALSGAAVIFERRFAHRRRRLRRRFNPYVAGPPVVSEDLFFGREALLDRVLQTVHNNSLLLFGERRIGKTSLQHQLKKRLAALVDPDYVFYPVYIDLQGTPEERFFATLAEDVFDQLGTHLDGLAPRRPETGPYGYRELVRDLHDVLRKLQGNNTRKVKIVLLIDEVDELNAYDPRINQKLRSLFMKSFAENLVAVVSGVEIRRRWEREGSPWYNFFEEIKVEALRSEEARSLIERPVRGMFKWEGGAVERVLALTGSKPYLIQKLCIALVQRMHEAKRSRITIADVEAVSRPEEV